MDLHTLRFFMCVAEKGSFTAASEALHYAQSNLSTQIRNLEDELGTSLFYRQKRGVILTAKGKMFYAYADRLLKLADESVSALQDTEQAKGTLHIGSLEATAISDLPEIFSSYHRNYPDVMLSLTTDLNGVFLNQVLNRSLDGAFVSSPGPHPELHDIYIKSEELILIGGITQQRECALDILREAPLITFPQGSIFRNRFELLLASHKIAYGTRLTVINSLAAMIVNIVSGLGYGYLPRSIVDSYINRGLMKAYPLDDPYSIIDILFIYRRDHLMTPAFRYFIDMIKG